MVWFDGNNKKLVMGDREGGGHGQRLLCIGGIDFNGREGLFWGTASIKKRRY